MVFPPDVTPEDRQRIEDDYFATNARINDELRDRGLLLPLGGNLTALEINEYLRSGRREL